MVLVLFGDTSRPDADIEGESLSILLWLMLPSLLRLMMVDNWWCCGVLGPSGKAASGSGKRTVHSCGFRSEAGDASCASAAMAVSAGCGCRRKRLHSCRWSRDRPGFDMKCSVQQVLAVSVQVVQCQEDKATKALKSQKESDQTH